jgi:cytochrome P450
LAIIGLAAAPLLAQTTRRSAIVPAFTPREAAPSFVVECYNNSASAVPWPTIRRIRVDGSLRELTGGIAGSLLGAPDERFEVAPGASHRVLFVLVQDANAGSSSPGRGLEARTRQGMYLPITPGTHRLAIECLGEWSDEITFAWSSDAPLGR